MAAITDPTNFAPVVRALRRLRLGRVAAIGLTTLLAFAAIAGVAAVIAEEVTSLAEELPGIGTTSRAKSVHFPAWPSAVASLDGRQRPSGTSAKSLRTQTVQRRQAMLVQQRQQSRYRFALRTPNLARCCWSKALSDHCCSRLPPAGWFLSLSS